MIFSRGFSRLRVQAGFGVGLIAVASLVSIGYAQTRTNSVPQLPSELKGNADVSEETKAAIFMLDLYQKGYAGGNTGICVDFSHLNLQSGLKIGFNTDAFVTGSHELRDVNKEELSKRLKNLLSAVSKAQGKPVNYSVTGYADGQHYLGSANLDASIKQNETLAANRAKTIAGLFQSEQYAKLVSTSGLASPALENSVPNLKPAAGEANGVKCDTRRKVVLDLEIEKPLVTIDGQGSISLAPDAFKESMSLGTIADADAEIKSARTQLIKSGAFDGRTEEKFGQIKFKEKYFDRTEIAGSQFGRPSAKSPEAERIFNELIKLGKISKKCDAYPLKPATLAAIHSAIDPVYPRLNLAAYLPLYINDAPSGQKPIEIENERGFGSPTVGYACFIPGQAWMDGLTKAGLEAGASAKVGNAFALTGPEMLAGKKGLTPDSPIKVGMDPNTLSEEEFDLLNPNGKGSTKQKKRGFFCKACGKGFFFEPAKDGAFHPDRSDRLFSDSNGTDSRLANALKGLTDENPLALGGFQRPRVFVVKDCKGCSCDPYAKVRDKAANVVTIDPLFDGDKKTYQTTVAKSDLDSACVLRPPMWHTCGFDPNSKTAGRFDSFENTLKYVDPDTGTAIVASDLDGLVSQLGNGRACDTNANPTLSQPLTPQDKINSVACSGSPANRLPTGDEMADCPAGN